MTERGGWRGIGVALAALWLAGSTAGAAAQAPRTVIWLEPGELDAAGAAGAERERVLRLELEARDIVLLESSAPRAPAGEPRPSADQMAAALLERSGTAAVLWLEGDGARRTSWLFVRTRASAVAKAPVPYPPDAIDPQLLAIAAASLLDQALSEPRPVPTPEQVAALAPQPEVEPQNAAPLPAPAARVPAPAPRTFFVQLGFALTLARVHPGMEASSKPTLDEVFIEQQVISDPLSGETEPRYLFDDSIPYVADADSFDDYENPDAGIPRGVTPLSTQCEADGIVTRAGELPSKFCARVAEPGFVPIPAIRVAVGAWLLPRLAVSVIYQWHLTIDPERFLGAQSLGVEGQYLLLGRRERGLGVLGVAGVSIGREETPVTQPGPGKTIHALAGPLGVSAGGAVRYAFGPELALVATPTLGTRFPVTQLTAELALATELSF